MGRHAYHGIGLKRSLQVLAAILFFTALSGFAQAATDEGSTKREAKQKAVGLKFYVETEMEYSDNVFGLTEEQQSAMESDDPAYIQNGRFREMESVSDYIVKPRVGLKFDAESPWGGRWKIAAWAQYNYYTRNEDAGYPEGRIRLSHSVGRRGALNLEVNYADGRFKKNYLSGYADANGNGNVTKEERIYSPATFDEYEGKLSYEHRFIDERNKLVSGLELQPYAGVRYRKFNSTFGNRDLDILFGGMEVNLEFLSRLGLELVYEYERISAPNGNELVLYDEEAAGRDVSGDGRIKANAALLTPIDRSSIRHTFEIAPSIKLTKDLSIYMEYGKRVAVNASDHPLDLDHFNTREDRERIKAGIKYNISKRWSARAEYGKQDEDEEDGSSSEKGCLLTIRCDL